MYMNHLWRWFVTRIVNKRQNAKLGLVRFLAGLYVTTEQPRGSVFSLGASGCIFLSTPGLVLYDQLLELFCYTDHQQTTKREAWFGTHSASTLCEDRAAKGLRFFVGASGCFFCSTWTHMHMNNLWSWFVTQIMSVRRIPKTGCPPFASRFLLTTAVQFGPRASKKRTWKVHTRIRNISQ